MAMETLVLGKCGNASTPVELIKGDNYTQKIMTRVPRYFGGVDLSPLAWSVTVENAAGATDEYALSAIRGEDAIEMEWIPGGTATAIPGITKFKLSGYAQDGSDVLIWQSGTYHIRVKDTFSHTPGSETAAELTEVQKLIIYVDGELNKVIKAGTDAAEAAKAANAAADRAEGVANGQRVTAIEKFTLKPDEPYAVTGELVQLDNFEGMPMNAVTRIEPVQAGSGDPYPGGGGKNLLDMRGAAGGTSNGITAVVNADGSYHISGTATSADINIWFRGNYGLTNPLFTLQPGTYYVRNVVLFNGTNVLGGLYTGGVFTLSAATPVTGIRCVSLNAGQAFDMTVYPAIYSGNSNQEWQPYANIRPISGHTEAKLTRCGKNLAKSIYASGDTAVYMNCLYVDADIMPNTTYTISFVANAVNANMLLYMNELLVSYHEFRITGARQSVTFTTKESKLDKPVAGKGYIMFKNGTALAAPMTFADVQLELGSTATVYEPYQGETFSASFGQTVYGGTLDWNTGVLTVDRAMATFTGNEVWSASSSNANTYYISSVDNSGVFPGVYNLEDFRERAYHFCSHYKATIYTDIMANNECNGYAGAGQSGTVGASFRFKDARIANVSDWKAYLAAQKAAGTPVQVCYKLATPTTIQLTPAYLTALHGMNNIFCDAGETTVSGRKDILWLTSGLIEQIDTLKKAIISLGGNV